MALETGDEAYNPQKETITEHDVDLPPEYCHYRDEGCDFAASCLNCPFPRCLYEEPRGRQCWLKGRRNREVARLFRSGRGIQELALIFGLSRRTIQRALKSTLSLCPLPSDAANEGSVVAPRGINRHE